MFGIILNCFSLENEQNSIKNERILIENERISIENERVSMKSERISMKNTRITFYECPEGFNSITATFCKRKLTYLNFSLVLDRYFLSARLILMLRCKESNLNR